MTDQTDDRIIIDSPIENDDHLYGEDTQGDDIEAAADEAPEADSPAEPEQEAMPVVVPEIDFADDPAVLSSIATLTGLGLSLSGRELYAAETGNFEFLEDWASSLRGQKGRQALLAVELLKQAHERFTKADELRAADITANIERLAGGKQEWKDLKAWSDQTASKEERAEIESALSHGGITAKMAVLALKAMRALHDAPAKDDTKAAPAAGVINRYAATGNAARPQINEAWYADQIESLARRYGNDMANTREFAQVSAAWAARKRRTSR